MALVKPENRSLSPETAAYIEANRRSDRRVSLLLFAPVFLAMILLALCTQLHSRTPTAGLRGRRFTASLKHAPAEHAAIVAAH